MFAYNQPTQFDLNALLNALQPQYVEQHQQQQQQRRPSPKILKKVETEEQYQIQIFKEHGNFNSYEVKVVKATPQHQGPFFFQSHQTQPQLVNIVIQSQEDDFKKVFQFRLQDIDLKNIDWQWFQSENVLVLNIPKKVRVCEDFSSLFGIPVQFQFSPYDRCGGAEYYRAEPSREQERADARADARAQARKAAEVARKEAENARREAEKVRRQAEKNRREAEEQARKEAEARRAAAEKARKEAERVRKEAAKKARKEAEKAAETKKAADKARRVAEERARREAEVHARNQRASQEKEKARPSNPQEEFIAEFLSQFLGPQFLGPNQTAQQDRPSRGPNFERPNFSGAPHEGPSSHGPQFNGPFPHPSQFQPPQTAKETKKSEYEPAAHVDSDSESIVSEPETASSNNSATSSPVKTDEKLHRSPSLEEVEDEEFVLFRKKFGQ